MENTVVAKPKAKKVNQGAPPQGESAGSQTRTANGVGGLPLFLGNAGEATQVQPKLTVTAPGDRHEAEADRVAAQVMGQDNAGPITPVDSQAGGFAVPAALIPSAPGEPLASADRARLAPRFGHNLDAVRVHAGAAAAQAAAALQAQAFTHGQHIYFGAGHYQPGQPAGQQLLAHELTHVVQQEAAAGPQAGPTAASGPSSAPIQRQVSDPIPETRNQFYAHGAFMGAARELLADPKWNRILQALMPDVHRDVSNALRSREGSDVIIPMLENNPVMAAYGLIKTQGMDQRREGGRADRIRRMQALEWDAFLPTTVVEAYKRAQTDEERDRLASQLVREMVIAHGTATQTALENATGYRQYSDVRTNRKSDLGGVLPGAWMDLFCRALTLAQDPNWETRAREYEDPTLHPRFDNPRDQATHLTFRNQLSFRDVVNLYKEIFHKETFSVLLDIKSRDATPQILRAVVRELNRRGVLVYGVGTFQHAEINRLGAMRQIVDGHVYAGPREVKFFHLAGDLQRACLAGRVAEGDTVMFNAGSLIDYDRYARGRQKKASYQIKQEVVRQLRIYQEHYGFHLGLYVQESDIDDRAATLITEVTNSNQDLFDLGFAWGGLSGRTASDIEPSLLNATVGTAGQHWVGTQWDPTLPLPAGVPSAGTLAGPAAAPPATTPAQPPTTASGSAPAPGAANPPASVASTAREIVLPPVPLIDAHEESFTLYEMPTTRTPFAETIIELPPPFFFATAGIYGNLGFRLDLFLRYGPGVLRNIRLVYDTAAARYTGTAQFYLPVAAGPRARLYGGLTGSVNLWGANDLEIIALAGGLEAIGQAPLLLAIGPSIRVIYDSGELSFSLRNQVDAGFALLFDLNALAEARLLGDKVWEKRWQLFHWQWGQAVRMGSLFSLDYNNGQLQPLRVEPFAERIDVDGLLAGLSAPAQQEVQTLPPAQQGLDARLRDLLTTTGGDPDLILLALAEASDAERSALLADATLLAGLERAIGATLWPTALAILNNAQSATTPSLKARTVFLADRHIQSGRFQDALHVIVSELQAGGLINGTLCGFTYVRQTGQGEGATFFPDYTVVDGRQVPTGASDVEIYDPAFVNVPWLYSTIMHEYVHVLQQQQAHPVGTMREPDFMARMEVEAYLWEIEHARGSGVIVSRQQMAEIGRRLRDHYLLLSAANQARYRDRYDAAQARVAEAQQGLLPANLTYSVDEARRELQAASRELSELIRRREGAPDDERREIDRQIAEIERRRTAVLVEVMLADNPNVQIVDPVQGIYRVPVVDGQGIVQYLYGSIVVAWHIAAVSPAVFSIGARISANDRPGVTTRLATAGTGVQGRVNPFPGDIDFVEEIDIVADSAAAGGESLALTIIDFVQRSQTQPDFEFLRMILFYRPRTEPTNSEAWFAADILAAGRNPVVLRRFGSKLTHVRAINSFWRAFVDGRFIDITKVLNVHAMTAAGDELFATESRNAGYNLAYLDQPAQIPASNLGEFAAAMREDARRLADAGNWLKAAKRAYNYFTVTGNLEAIRQLEPVFRTDEAMVSQQSAALEAVAGALLPARDPRGRRSRRGFPSRILPADEARSQLERVAAVIEHSLPTVGTPPRSPAAIATALRRAAARCRGDATGLLRPDVALSDEINTLFQETKALINQGVAGVVEPVINTYIR